MPDKHLYFSIGASLGTIAVYGIALAKDKLEETSDFVKRLSKKEPDWFLYFPIVIFLVALWGLIPDILHALNILPKEVTRGPFFDLFFAHSTFERIEDTYPEIDRWLNWIGEGLLFLIAIGIMFYYIRLIKRLSKDKEAQ